MNPEFAVVLVDPKRRTLVHVGLTETSPNVATLKEFFEELVVDPEFGNGDRDYTDSLLVETYGYEELIEKFPCLLHEIRRESTK